MTVRGGARECRDAHVVEPSGSVRWGRQRCMPDAALAARGPAGCDERAAGGSIQIIHRVPAVASPARAADLVAGRVPGREESRKGRARLVETPIKVTLRSTADSLPPRQSPPAAAADQDPPRIEHVWINDPGEAGYRILQPIPVEIRRVEVGDVEASFREANIAMSGSDGSDALQALAAEILETFDVLVSEQNLGPDAADQRRLLCTYIART